MPGGVQLLQGSGDAVLWSLSLQRNWGQILWTTHWTVHQDCLKGGMAGWSKKKTCKTCLETCKEGQDTIMQYCVVILSNSNVLLDKMSVLLIRQDILKKKCYSPDQLCLEYPI